jgi:hypothetical protein
VVAFPNVSNPLFEYWLIIAFYEGFRSGLANCPAVKQFTKVGGAAPIQVVGNLAEA